MSVPAFVAVIINPIAGGRSVADARRQAERAAALIGDRGEPADVVLTERRGHARELTAAAVSRGARLVVAWGGDGTVNEVASVLAFSGTPMAVVPSGSGNGLARALGIRSRPLDALADALAAVPRRIDAGELDGRLFFSVAGIGFDAHVAACFDREGARRGLVNYVRLSARELARYRPGSYRINSEDGVRRAFLLTLANSSQFGNGARIAPDARVDDGRLDLVVFEERSRMSTVLAVPRLFTGGVARVAGVSIRQVETVEIRSDTPMLYHVDGEPIAGGTALSGRVHPGALGVCVRA
jgi:YegS/Rv2252/BmrU family lipid kinase